MINLNNDMLLKLALTFRLSLKNLCKILGRPETSESQMDLYNTIAKKYNEDFDLKIAYKYLFNSETINESEKQSKKAYNLAAYFLQSYINAKRNNDELKMKKLLLELDKVENDFNKLKNKHREGPITLDEVLVISKYRLKYAISREKICAYLGMSVKGVKLAEEKIEDEKIKQDLINLTEYYIDVTKSKRNVR